MKTFTVVELDEDRGEATIRLASGEEVFLFIGRLSPQDLNIRAAKVGLFGGGIWHFCLTSNKQSAGLNGNIVHYDPARHEAGLLLLGYCSTFTSIAEMKSAQGNHVSRFDADGAVARLVELGIVRAAK